MTTPGEPQWIAMIEEDTNRQQNGRQVLGWSLDKTFATEDEARTAAWDLAHGHTSQHPWSEKSRTVVHHDDFNYTVVVHGATQSFHFRVQVGLVYGGPARPQGYNRYGDPLPG